MVKVLNLLHIILLKSEITDLQIFAANNGRNDIVKHNLVETARASIVRFQPTEFRNHKALRVQLYGVIAPAGELKYFLDIFSKVHV